LLKNIAMEYNILDRNKLAGILLCIGLLVPFHSFSQKKAKDRPLVADPGSACDTSSWKLVFQDEFEGRTLDHTKWITYFPYTSDGSDNCEACRFMEGTNTIVTDDQVTVRDGVLKLNVTAETSTWYSKTAEHKGSMIRSIGDAEFNYGKFEIRCKLPEGDGIGPAFWMFGGQTEIDVFELCMEKPNVVKTSLHLWGEPKYSITEKYKGLDNATDFHTYAAEWERDELRFYLDGEVIDTRGRYTDRRGKPLPGCDRDAGNERLAPYYPRPQDRVNVIAGNGADAPNRICNGPRTPVPWPEGSAMLVDYIRVYQRQPQERLNDLCSVPKKLVIERYPAGDTCSPIRKARFIGAHGALFWEVSKDLRIIEEMKDGILVEKTGDAGEQWVRAISTDDPCTANIAVVEIPFEFVSQ